MSLRTLFSKKQKRADLVSVAEHTSMTRDYAIEYIVSLDRSAKERFIEAVELIWQGYDKLDRVKTRDEKAIEREAKISGSDDEDIAFILADSTQPKTGGSEKQ